jgi:hypothetical protein
MKKKGRRDGGSIRISMSRTIEIEVCLLFNLAVVFDFMYLHFRHSKAKSIGDVLMIRVMLRIPCCVSVFLLFLFAASLGDLKSRFLFKL